MCTRTSGPGLQGQQTPDDLQRTWPVRHGKDWGRIIATWPCGFKTRKTYGELQSLAMPSWRKGLDLDRSTILTQHIKCEERAQSVCPSLSNHNKLPSCMRTARSWVITQRVVVISCRLFGTTYRSHLQGSIWRIGCPEKSVRNYHYSLRNNPEARSYLLYGGSRFSMHITVQFKPKHSFQFW
jgi:hypothetical protein